MSDDPGSKIPSGRLARFARMATLTARTASDLAIGKARRALGDDSYTQERQAATKVLETLGTMKGAAMKLGQQLAMEADALPPEAREIVSRLFAQAPPMSYDDIKGVITEELGDPPESVFLEFDQAPMASASLGQVHKAKLKDGTAVAVKVQYPGVAEALVNDLKNGALFMRAFHGPARSMTGVELGPYVEEIRREIGAETDYMREAQQGREFARSVACIPDLHVPAVFSSYSTGRVLTMELVEGRRLNDFAQSDADDEARFRVGRQLVLALYVPLVSGRLVHGDPHPGNYLVRPDGRLTVLDFGAVKKLSPELTSCLWGLLQAELDRRPPDFVALFGSAGYTFTGGPEMAVKALTPLHEIVARPVRQDVYDWSTCTIAPDVRAFLAQEIKDVVGKRSAAILSPPESMLFYRAIGGLANNLRTLRAKGSFRSVVQEIAQLRAALAA